MAMHVSNAQQVNGTHSPSAEEAELYDQLLRLRDAVIAGTHPQLKLPPAAVELLKARRNASTAVAGPAVNGFLSNGVAFNTNGATNSTQQSSSTTASTFPDLPGLQAPSQYLVNNSVPPALKPTSSSGLDPIFLEKADSLVRAEGQLKRQRIERELQTQFDQRRPMHGARDKDAIADAPVALDVETILAKAAVREPHISGLVPPGPSTPSSFDENDYYSSQVESEWNSPESASKGSDRAAGAAFIESHGATSVASASHAKSTASALHPGQSAKDHAVQVNSLQSQGVYDVDEDDDDDEYDPEDVTAFENFPNGSNTHGHVSPPEDDDSDYEPGEITQESAVPTPHDQGQHPAHQSPQVPVIRNHLTHIAAPQPNRVSPLAVAKRPSIELELVNGRPEVVQKGLPNHSRASTGSPPNGIGGSGRKQKKKNKRKRDQEPHRNNKKTRRERNAAVHSPPSPAHTQPYIKDEPISPPPFANVPEVQPFGQRATQYRPTEIDLVSPRHVPPSVQYANEAPRSALRYEYAPQASPSVVRAASPAHRAVQRDTQDLRRVASLHYAQRVPSPTQRAYSPAPSRIVSMTYGDPRLSRAIDVESPQYQDQVPQDTGRYVRHERSRSPPRLQEYHDPYARVSSPAMMPPPAAPPRRIVVDQYGNRYYAAEPVAALQQPPPPRASVAPIERRPTMEIGYERAPSRMASSYAQQPVQYETADRMPPPPSRRTVADDRTAYIDAGGYRMREYEPASGQVRYVEAPTSPTYQPVATPRYETMAPPPAREPTSPVYAPTRSYSVRPEELAPLPTYAARQASVAPAQYERQEPVATPTRAMSVMPGFEQPTSATRAYSHAPAQMRYVDQYGREVFPSEVRQAPVADYRYQQ